jgi:hypothetical protein
VQNISLIQRQAEDEEREEETIQTKMNTGQPSKALPQFERSFQSMRGGGQPLDQNARAYFEPRFGIDFSNVRIHTNNEASETARSINARAYTVGNNIVFKNGNYVPESEAGKKLLAHELAHVIQQKGENRNIIRRWDGEYHELMTRTIGNKLNYKPSFLSTLSYYNVKMDDDSKDPPDHGECKGYSGKNYKCLNKASAVIINKSRQDKYLRESIKEQNIYNKVKINGFKYTNPGEINSLWTKIRKMLGYSLHIAQDRGAHGEGIQGYGHSSLGDKCDDPSYNITGWEIAGHNTAEVFNEFDKGIRGEKIYKAGSGNLLFISFAGLKTVPFSRRLGKRVDSYSLSDIYVPNGGEVRVTCLGRYSPPLQKLQRYNISLFKRLHGYGFDRGSAYYHVGRSLFTTWNKLPKGHYYLRIEKYCDFISRNTLAVEAAANAGAVPQPPSNDDVLAGLTKYIPTESVTLYIATVSAMGALKSYGLTEAVTYWFFVCLTPVFLLILFLRQLAIAQKDWKVSPTQWPWWRIIASTVAFVVWALAVPCNPLIPAADANPCRGRYSSTRCNVCFNGPESSFALI